MGIYGRPSARATKKRTRAKKKVRKLTYRAKKEAKLKKRKPRKVAAPSPSSRAFSRARSKRPAKKAGGKKRKVAAKRRPAKKPRAPAEKRKVLKRKRAVTKKPSRKVLRRETRKVREQIKKLTKAEQKSRGKSKRSPVKTKLRAKKRAVAKRRVKRSIVIQRLPHKTPSQERRSKESEWERRQRRFLELLKIAKATGQTPARKRVPRRVSSQYNVGEQRIVPVDRVIAEDEVEDILYLVEERARKMKGTFSLWSATLFLSVFGEKMIGSGQTLIELTTPDQDAMFFTTETHESTGTWNSYEGMFDKLRDVLESLASASRTVVFLHYIKLFNQDRK